MFEEENEIIENTSLKLNSNMTSYSISAFNDDASTYMGVKSVNEEQSLTTTNHKNKNKKMKKANSFSSIIESSYSNNSNSSSQKKKSANKMSNQKKIEKTPNSDKNNNNKEKGKEKEKKEIEKIKTLFEWDGGGQLVYITGSFCNWKQFFKMEKNVNNGKFTLFLDLPRGFHQYKFKVDEKWEFSKNYPKFEENGNINNFIDTTDYQIEDGNKLIEQDNNKNDNINKIKTKEKEEKKEIEKEEEKNNKKVNNKSPGKKKKKHKKRLSSTHTVNFLNSQNNYTTYYPLKSELNIKPSSLPSLYKAHFILNEDFKPKKEKRFTKVEYVNDSSSNEDSESSSSSLSETSSEQSSKVTIFGEIIPYVKFQNLYHIHSNHLHTKMVNYKNTNVISMTSRYRIKFSTFIYYKPYISQEKKRKKHSKTVKIKVKKQKQK